VAEEWKFKAAPKLSALSYRTAPAQETLARARSRAPRVPITRVSDLTPLDRLRLPVFCAVTPLARDLTTHMGKGPDLVSAEVSALMEAIERVSAEQVERPTPRQAFRNLSNDRRPLDPREFDLPEDSVYREDRAISWIDGWDLLRDEPIWIALDLAISPPRDGVLLDVDTNGLASGNTLLEAIVHALCEVIERDAMGIRLFRTLFGDADEHPVEGRRILPASLPAHAREWVETIAAADLHVETETMDSDIGVPVFRSVIIDTAYASTDPDTVRTFVGFGASPDAAVAVTRSIAEAVQSRVAIIQGARDSFNTLSPAWRRSSPRAHLSDLEARNGISLSTLTTFSSDDLLDDLRYLLRRLRDAGAERVVAVNLTRADLGVPVVRIRVPGLTSFAVNRRRFGWRCARYLL